MTDNTRPDGEAVPVPGLTARDQGGDERAIGPLVKTLEDRDVDLRRSAALALGEIRDPRVVAPLMRAARDPDPEVRRWAVLGLSRAGGLAAIPALTNALRDQSDAVRAAAEEALERVGEPAVLPLIAALGHSALTTRRCAASILGRIADERAITPLIRMLQGLEVDPPMHRAAAAALGEMASRRPSPQLRHALPVLRWTGDRADREIIRRIEAAIAVMADLPIPATLPQPDMADLPIPAAPAPEECLQRGRRTEAGPARSSSLSHTLRRWIGRGRRP